MTTNQTIDGVPRERLEDAARAARIAGYTGLAEELRALLDEPSKPDYLESCEAAHLGILKHCKPAAQGEPVAYRYKELQQAWESEKPWELATVSLGRVYLERKELAERGVLVGKERETYLGLTIEPLYAEQPAPVGVVTPHPVQWYADYSDTRKSEIDGWNACLDELKRLNPSL